MTFVGPQAEEFGPYVVYEQLGLGGMATVHRAETQGIAGFSKQVALKRMLPSVAADRSLVKSFIREAQLASHLRHANVAQTYDLGKVGDTYFIAMELVPGRNLREILKHCAAVVGHMPMPIAMNIVNQICDALDYAHNLCDETGRPLGIIHRDVSPSNIIVSDGGVVKLIDFGIAKATASTGMNTMSGTIKGKFGYMAPEYLMGSSLDARADLFALGVIAHELLSNRPLFQGKDEMDTLYRVKDMPILPPSRINPKVPPEIDAIVMTALERNPDHRWQRANALREALTTEAKRLGQVAHNAAVVEWIEWAFNQSNKPSSFAGESEPMISIGGGTAELPRGSAAAIVASTPRAHAPTRPTPLPAHPRTSALDDEDSMDSMDGQETILKPTDDHNAKNWGPSADMTTPAGNALDEAIASTRADPTKLVRKSAQYGAATPDPALVDPRRDRSSRAASNDAASAARVTDTLRDHPAGTPTLRDRPGRDSSKKLEKASAKASTRNILPRRDTPAPRLPPSTTAPTTPNRPVSRPSIEAGASGEMTVRDAKDPLAGFDDDDEPNTLPPRASRPSDPHLAARLSRTGDPQIATRPSRPIEPNARPSRPSDAHVPRSDARAQTILDPSAEPPPSRLSQPAAVARPTPQPPLAPQPHMTSGLADAPSPHIRTLPGQGTPVPPPVAPAVALPPVAQPAPRPTPLPPYAPRDALNDLAVRGERPSAAQIFNGVAPRNAQVTSVRTRVAMIKRRSASNFLLAVLVLIAAGGAAAVVYFALPYLT